MTIIVTDLNGSDGRPESFMMRSLLSFQKQLSRATGVRMHEDDAVGFDGRYLKGRGDNLPDHSEAHRSIRVGQHRRPNEAFRSALFRDSR